MTQPLSVGGCHDVTQSRWVKHGGRAVGPSRGAGEGPVRPAGAHLPELTCRTVLFHFEAHFITIRKTCHASPKKLEGHVDVFLSEQETPYKANLGFTCLYGCDKEVCCTQTNANASVRWRLYENPYEYTKCLFWYPRTESPGEFKYFNHLRGSPPCQSLGLKRTAQLLERVSWNVSAEEGRASPATRKKQVVVKQKAVLIVTANLLARRGCCVS